MKYWDLTLSPKGQVTLPKELRDQLNLRPGDQMIYTIIDGQIIITPKNVDFNDLAGLLGAPPRGNATLEEIDDTVAQAAGANALDVADDLDAEEAAA
jgi:AbrB family looped-hinge helix DNA binding protein